MRLGALPCAILIAVSACSSAPEIRYYTLSGDSQPTAALAAAMPSRYAIDTIHLPEVLDRPQIVVATSANRIDVLDYDRWSAPLSDLLRRVVVADLSARLGAAAIAAPGLPATDPDVRHISLSVLAFEPRRQGTSLVEASWTITSDVGGAGPRSQTFRTRRTATTTGSGVEGAISIPMLLAERVDAFTAMGTSMAMVWNNLKVMLTWGAVVLVLFLLSLATGLLGLIVVFPVLGHGTWHAYRAIQPQRQIVPASPMMSSRNDLGPTDPTRPLVATESSSGSV